MEVVKRKRGRPAGALSGSKYNVDESGTPHIVTQIRHAVADDNGCFTIKHHANQKSATLSKKIFDEFYDTYFNLDKPDDKNIFLEQFGVKYFGIVPKPIKKISLYDAVGKAEAKRTGT